MVIRYRDLRKLLCDFLVDPIRRPELLEEGRLRLRDLADNPGCSPFMREDARASLGALETFQRSLNALGLSGIPLTKPPAGLPPLIIENVEIPVALDLMIQIRDRRHGLQVGGVLFRLSKGSETETEGASNKRREIGKNAAVLVHMMASERLAGAGTSQASICYSVDVHQGEAHAAPRSYVSIERNVRAACRTIAARWDAV